MAPLLGHMISKQEIKPDPTKTEKVQQYLDCWILPESAAFQDWHHITDSLSVVFLLLLQNNVPWQRGMLFPVVSWLWGVVQHVKWLTNQCPCCGLLKVWVGSCSLSNPGRWGHTLNCVRVLVSRQGWVKLYYPWAGDLETCVRCEILFHYTVGHPCVAYTDYSACLSILNIARPSGKLVHYPKDGHHNQA